MRLVIAPCARQDIRLIGHHIGEDDPHYAAIFIEDLHDCLGQLAEAPYRFPVWMRRPALNLRIRPFGRYAIYYRIGEERVDIVRVLHMARDRDAIFGRDAR